MASSVESPFLKKYEGKITIVSREGLGANENKSAISSHPRRAGRQTYATQQSTNPSTSTSTSTSTPTPTSTSTSTSTLTNLSTSTHASNQSTPNTQMTRNTFNNNTNSHQGIIQVRQEFLNNVPDNTISLPPLRAHPSIFTQDTNSTNNSNDPTFSYDKSSMYTRDYSANTNSFQHQQYQYQNQQYQNQQYQQQQYQQQFQQEPSLDQLRKIAAEHKHRDYSTSHTIFQSSPLDHGFSSQVHNFSPSATHEQNGANSSPRSVGLRRHGSPRSSALHLSPSSAPPSAHFSSPIPPQNTSTNSPGRGSSKGQFRPHGQSLQPTIPDTSYKQTPFLALDPINYDPFENDSNPDSDNAKEQLYFSKQPREVYFKPHSLSDYRRLKEELSSFKMGNLGPDLQSAEYLAKKDQKTKMKEYSKNLRAFHNTSGLPSGPGKVNGVIATTNPTTEEKRAAKEKREKAKSYASKIPKPRGRSSSSAVSSAAVAPADEEDLDDDLDEDEDEMMIREMEIKHQLARDNVLQIRKEFGLT